jgi:hydrogenase nickel incorporation protein HypA/HybF
MVSRMHELSIAATILERAQRASAQHGDARVIKVGLRIGEISGVEPDALSFGFEALAKDTPIEGAVLEIELCKRRQRCGACEAVFEPEGYVTACPSCQSDNSVCVAGKELDVMFIELEDAPCA